MKTIINEVIFLTLVALVCVCGVRLTNKFCQKLAIGNNSQKFAQLMEFAKQVVVDAEHDGLIDKLTAEQQAQDALNRFNKLLTHYGITNVDNDMAKQMIEKAWFDEKQALDNVYHTNNNQPAITKPVQSQAPVVASQAQAPTNSATK